MHRAQAPLVDILLDLAHAVVKAVDHADDQDLARFALSLHHLLHLGIGAGGGLFAQHVFASAQRVNGDHGMHPIGGAHRDGVNFRIVDNVVIIRHSNAAAIFFNGRLCALRNDVAKILDLHIRVFHIGGDVRRVGNGAAADNAYLDHGKAPFICAALGRQDG